jgi:CheY-like chemotaxis protein
MPRPWRILLVDDDRDGREMCAEFLGSVGFETLHAENGARALEVAAARRPDLILMDLEMPVMGGLEAIARLRARPETSAIPVVAMTGSVFELARARDAGCAACLAKPCSPTDLESVVQCILELDGPDQLHERKSGT